MTHSLEESLAGGSPVDWARDFLTRAGFPATVENLEAVYSWELAESGGGGGMWNPLNTTQGGYPGETNANAVGVKNYVRRDDGLDACAKVIHNGFYAAVVSALARGDSAQQVANAIVLSPWGTRHIALHPLPGPPAPDPGEPMNVPQFVCIGPTSPHDGPDVFALNPDGTISHKRRVDGSWSQWRREPAPPAGTHLESLGGFANEDGRLELVAYPQGGGTLHVSQSSPGGSWGKWVPL